VFVRPLLSVVSLFFGSGDVGRYKLEGQIILWRMPTSISCFNTVKEEFTKGQLPTKIWARWWRLWSSVVRGAKMGVNVSDTFKANKKVLLSFNKN
jgi:hypothetical protein